MNIFDPYILSHCMTTAILTKCCIFCFGSTQTRKKAGQDVKFPPSNVEIRPKKCNYCLSRKNVLILINVWIICILSFRECRQQIPRLQSPVSQLAKMCSANVTGSWNVNGPERWSQPRNICACRQAAISVHCCLCIVKLIEKHLFHTRASSIFSFRIFSNIPGNILET